MANATQKTDVLVSVQFDLEKETKGAVRYQERGHAPLIGTLTFARMHSRPRTIPKL